MSHYDCPCRRHEPPETLLLPSQRYFEIDPPADPPGSASVFCQRWMREREQAKAAQDRRRAKGIA